MKTQLLVATLCVAMTTHVYGQRLNAAIAAREGEFAQPQDAVPSPDGTVFYFTAVGPRGAGVFRVPAGGGPVTELAAGAPFVRPLGLTASGDGLTVYVADPDAWAGGGLLGHIFALSATGGAPRAIRGAQGLRARGVESALEGGEEFLYFSGRNARGRAAGVYKLPASGANTPLVVLEGAPLVEPDGIAVGRSGTIYVADRGPNPFAGSVYRIERGTVSTVVELMRAGIPAGIAVSMDENRLLVSTLQPYRNRAQVLMVDLSTSDLSDFTETVGENPGAGGLHRARNASVFAWCGAPRGPVYNISGL